MRTGNLLVVEYSANVLGDLTQAKRLSRALSTLKPSGRSSTKGVTECIWPMITEMEDFTLATESQYSVTLGQMPWDQERHCRLRRKGLWFPCQRLPAAVTTNKCSRNNWGSKLGVWSNSINRSQGQSLSLEQLPPVHHSNKIWWRVVLTPLGILLFTLQLLAEPLHPMAPSEDLSSNPVIPATDTTKSNSSTPSLERDCLHRTAKP